LSAEFEVSSEVWATQEDINTNAHLVGELPRQDFPEVLESSHGDRSCNRGTRPFFKKSFENREGASPTISETATSGARAH
jgi:hypothetical protein